MTVVTASAPTADQPESRKAWTAPSLDVVSTETAEGEVGGNADSGSSS